MLISDLVPIAAIDPHVVSSWALVFARWRSTPPLSALRALAPIDRPDPDPPFRIDRQQVRGGDSDCRLTPEGGSELCVMLLFRREMLTSVRELRMAAADRRLMGLG